MSLLKLEKSIFLNTRSIDSSDHLKASGILDYFQDIASLHAHELGIGYESMKIKNLAWVILAASFKINDIKINNLSDISIKTWPKKPKKIEFEREFEITFNDDILAYGDSLWCLIDLEKRTIVRSSNASFIGEHYDYTRYNDGINRKLSLELDNPDMEYHKIIEASFIDHNMHMNNAKYLDIVEDMIGLNKYISSCEISFLHEAKYKEEMIIKHQYINGFDCYVGFVNESIAFELKAIIKENI